MSKWHFKIIPKKQVDGLVKQHKDILIVETTHQSKPGHHLIMNAESGRSTLGRVSKNIFKWYELIKADEDWKFINISYWKFK